MENRYLSRTMKLLEQVRPRLATTHQLEFKNCFGAIAGYVDGRIFISCGKFGVALRLPSETLDGMFEEKSVRHLRYFPRGHVKREYAVLSRRILADERRLKRLIDESVTYALSRELSSRSARGSKSAAKAGSGGAKGSAVGSSPAATVYAQ